MADPCTNPPVQRTGLDPRPTKSRKFVAYLIAEGSWKALAALALCLFKDSMSVLAFGVLLAIIVVAGFMEVIYIGNQANLDKYVRVTELVVGAGKDMSMGALQVNGDKTAKTPPGESE